MALAITLLFIVPARAQTYKALEAVNGLAIGSKVNPFIAQDSEGKKYNLAKALKKGPVVIIFYRGQWCPVCNKHLSELQDSLKFIYEKGATVIAISPEKPEFLQQMKNKTKSTFTLLYDKDYEIGNQFDVIFRPEEKLIGLYNSRLNAQLSVAHSDSSSRLPVPATFIINKKGIVTWRQFNRDYRVRASVKEILENLPTKKLIWINTRN